MNAGLLTRRPEVDEMRSSGGYIALIVSGLLCIQFVLTSGTFSPSVFGGVVSAAQRPIAILAMVLAGLGFLWIPTTRGTLHRGLSLGVFGFVLYLYLLAIGSDYWSGVLVKTTMLAVSTACAFLVASRFRFVEIARILQVALLIAVILSIVCVVLFPALAISTKWGQTGNWKGIFTAKNILGYSAGYLFLLSGIFLLVGGRSRLNWAGVLVGAASCIFSGSRGALLYSIVAVLFAVAVRRRGWLKVAIAAALLAFAVVMVALIVGMSVGVDGDMLQLGDHQVLINRMPLWSYAFELWGQRPIFGYGLGGAWSPVRTAEFFSRNEWVLDNFHSGYLSNFVELGVFGFSGLFLLLVFTAVKIYRGAYTGRGSDADFIMSSSFFVLFVMTNFTETFLLRSTDVRQFVFMCAIVSLWQAGQVSNGNANMRLVGRAI